MEAMVSRLAPRGTPTLAWKLALLTVLLSSS
jgi:hypothetical protein